jgi:serine protease Do
VAVLSTAALCSRASDLLQTLDAEISSLYEKSKPSIVRVSSVRQIHIGNFSLPQRRAGTAFFIDEQGHLLTAGSVVEEADACTIEWDGQQVPVKIVGRDPQTNLALLQADVQPAPLRLGNSDELRVGSMVVAIGFPFDLPSEPSVGFVSGIEIQSGGHMFVTSHVRAGCKLRPGQGGAPLFNTHGEVVGVAVAAHSDDQSYALPINAAKKVANDFLQFGETHHGWVGLGITQRKDSSEGCLEGTKVVVQQVYSNTPAALAGFRDNDVLLKITTNRVHSIADVLNRIFYYHCGERVGFTVLRDGEEKDLTLVVADRPVSENAAAVSLPPLPPGALPHGGQLRIVPASQQQLPLSK